MTDSDETLADISTSARRDLRRDFGDRDEMIAYLRDQFPEAAIRDERVSPTIGGRRAAESQLAEIDPATYARTRNELDGRVTRLSPYIRHGVVSLPEVRDAAVNRVRRRGDVSKLVQELAWRDYWQRLYVEHGNGIIWNDWEAWKTGYPATRYADELPNDLLAGETGLPCMDGFVSDLYTSGYIHNHARMWLAAYVIHWRGVHWRVGAAWFLNHLLDGDPASNNLSWQWVASTYGSKPYIFNRENLERYTNSAYCRTCPLYGRCPFEGSYDELGRQLFPNRTIDSPDAQRQSRR